MAYVINVLTTNQSGSQVHEFIAALDLNCPQVFFLPSIATTSQSNSSSFTPHPHYCCCPSSHLAPRFERDAYTDALKNLKGVSNSIAI